MASLVLKAEGDWALEAVEGGSIGKLVVQQCGERGCGGVEQWDLDGGYQGL